MILGKEQLPPVNTIKGIVLLDSHLTFSEHISALFLMLVSFVWLIGYAVC